MKAPWHNPRGEISVLKAAAFGLLFVPAIVLATQYEAKPFGPRPTELLNQGAGLWTIRLLLLSLAVTPLRAIWRWPELVQVRRMIGVAAFAYGALHLVAYAADQAWDLGKVASEIVLRTYLTVGFAALVLLAALAATSFDAAIRRMGGPRWRRLHRVVYVAAALGSVHFFLQSKVGVTQPIIIIACAIWLGAWRLANRRTVPVDAGSPGFVAALSAAVAAAAALAEAAYYHFKLGAPMLTVLKANVMTEAGLRPAWVLLALGLVVVAGAVARTALPARRAAAG